MSVIDERIGPRFVNVNSTWLAFEVSDTDTRNCDSAWMFGAVGVWLIKSKPMGMVSADARGDNPSTPTRTPAAHAMDFKLT